MGLPSVIIESDVPFSESRIWSSQREYYDKQGIAAWAGEVPFYITSNVYMAASYAKLVLRFMQDWTRRNPDAKKHPFYLIELGTGSGQFSYYFLRQFIEMRQQLGLTDLKFCYVMSDFTQANVDFWRAHPDIRRYAKEGVLDFAIFDVENDDEVTLQESGQVISAKSLYNPLITVANYLFDSVVSDVFQVRDGELYECRTTTRTTEENYKNDAPVDWQEVSVTFEDYIVTGDYYQDPLFNQVLHSYKGDLENGTFFFPVGSLRVIRQLRALCNDKLLLLTSDKGFVGLDELEGEEHPELDFHGSFSVMVNYDAISRYFHLLNGDAVMQCPRDAIVTAAFITGEQFDQFIEMRWALDQYVSEFSPADYFNIYEHVQSHPELCALDTLSSALSLSHWDPGLYDDVSERISDLIEEADYDLINYLKKYLYKVAENFYLLPGCNDTIFAVATFYQEVMEYETALKYFQISRHYFPASWELEFNCGYCAFHLNRHEEALAFFNEALTFNPKSKETKHWIEDTKEVLNM
jgi:hypothetical protein